MDYKQSFKNLLEVRHCFTSKAKRERVLKRDLGVVLKFSITRNDIKQAEQNGS
jgi:hypothetical protein